MRSRYTLLEPAVHALRALLLAVLFAYAAVDRVNAQVATAYTFGQAAGTYTAITGGTALWTTNFDDQVSGAQTIPAFLFDGTTYTAMFVSANGFITFGAAPGGTNYTALSNGATYARAISAFSQDMVNAGSGTRDVRWQTVGNETVIQWRGIRRYRNAFQTWAENYSFQIRLNHTTGVIRVVYGPIDQGPANSGNMPQVGLRGPNNTFATNVNNRTVGTGTENWATSLAGANNASTMRFTGAAPAKAWASGLTYTWTPVCVAPTATFTAVNNCGSNNFTVQMNLTSFGFGSSGTLSYQVNNGSTVDQAVSALGTVTIGPFQTQDVVTAYFTNVLPGCSTPTFTGFSTCPVNIVCGTTVNVSHCYTNNDTRTFLFIAPIGESVNLDFIAGTMDPSDVIRAYSGTDNNGPLIGSLTGTYANLFGVAGTSNFNELFLEIESNGTNSCATGQQSTWEFEVKCTPQCVAPDGFVTILSDCNTLTFSLAVEVSFTGDGATTTLAYSVDGGATQTVPGLVASDVEQIGPFSMSSTVNVRLLHESSSSCDRNLGNFTRDVTCPPANDACSNAVTLSVKTPAQCPSQSTPGSTFDGVSEIGAPSCNAGGTISDVWYRFNSGFNQSPILVSVAAGSIGHWGMEIYTGCGGTLVGCVPNSPTGVNLTNASAYTDYWVRIFTNTSLGATGTFTICVSATPQASSCGGVIRDPGGTGAYPDNSNVTTTYCPTNPGEILTLTFTEFDTEAGFDFVRVYNGPNASWPLLGTFSGNSIPGPFTSTHPSGCLTVNFTSDPPLTIFGIPIANTFAGYTASTSCCQGPAPTISLTSNSPLCTGSTLQLNCDAGTVFSWSGPSGFTSAAQNPTRANLTLAHAGTYTVTARTGANGCPTVASIPVVVNASPSVPVITPSSATACAGSPTGLSASSTPPTVSSTFNGGAITINASGIAAPYPSQVVASALPTAGVIVRSVQLNGFTHTYPEDVDIVLRSPTGNNVILMSDVGGGTDVTGLNFVFRDGFAAMGTGTLTSGTYRCSSPNGPDNFPAPGPGSLNQTNPLLSAFTGNHNGTWQLFLMDDAAGDAGFIASWSITFEYADQVSYAWSPNVALNATTGASVIASPTAAQTYTVTATNVGNGCAQSANATITVNPLPVVTCGGPYGPTCSNNGLIALVGSPSGGTWSGPGVSGSNFDPAVAGPGSHVLGYSYTDGNTCTSNCQVTVVVNAPPVVSCGNYGPACSSDAPIALSGSPAGGTWSGNGVSGASFDPSAGTQVITYSYTDGNGCSSTCQTTINVTPADTWYEDQDGDGFGDPNSTEAACAQPTGYVSNADDTCPEIFGQIGDACDAGPNFVLGAINGDCDCIGQACTTDLVLSFNTDNNGDEISWELRTQVSNILVQSGGGTLPSNADGFPEMTCLPDGSYYLNVLDAGGDGITGGGYVLRIGGAAGAVVIDNMQDGQGVGGFTNGFLSSIAAGQGFDIPMGTDRLLFTSCGKQDWVSGEYIVANDNAAVNAQWGVGDQTDDGYVFWFYNPNGGYSFRRFRSHATSDGFPATGPTRACHTRLNSWTAVNHIPTGEFMNVKIRSRVNGTNSNWGPACRFMIDPVRAACPLTHLLDIPGHQFFSCGVTKTWGGNNRVHAQPVSGATQYQFRFYNLAEGIDVTRTNTTYYVNLNWTPALPNGQYSVEVRTYKNGSWCIATAPWGDVCGVSITGSSAMGGVGQHMPGVGTGAFDEAQLSLFPNPNNGEVLTVSLSALEEGVNTVSVELFDLTGARVSTTMIGTQEGRVFQHLQLGELASGVYLVSITAGSERYTERLVIQR